ncbi:carbohydrate kinase family protein [Agathobaculum sp.]|uniref:carbohydrate kinase family protein n=1 Tax=Agathobaculum sp. TaxID=2048138 RepID=UPI002A81D3D8|nr:carbohydrate kinase [Agathobaculum sp.]MDY3618954.1 carbohydrate kinase [Agathobaculum sp.]
MKRVVAIGELLIDFVPQQKDCKLSEVTHFERVVGGAPANAAVAVARLGGEAAMISQVGEDAFGTHILDVLEKNGVDAAHVFRTSRAYTGLAFVSLDATGNRDFSFFRNPSADLFLSPEQITEKIFNKCAALHFCSVDLVDWPVKKAHLRAIELARKAGAFISFDPNVRLPLWSTPDACSKAISEFLPYADLIKLSDDEIGFVTGEKDEMRAAKKMLAGGCKLVLVTRGANGSTAYTPQHTAYCDALSVDAKDTTGAGDSFIGSFLFQLVRDDLTADRLALIGEARLAEYLRFSACYASLTVQKKGAVMATLPELRRAYPEI